MGTWDYVFSCILLSNVYGIIIVDLVLALALDPAPALSLDPALAPAMVLAPAPATGMTTHCLKCTSAGPSSGTVILIDALLLVF